MAAIVRKCYSDFSRFLAPFSPSGLTTLVGAPLSVFGVRWASKKQGGSTAVRPRKHRGKGLGLKIREGEFAQAGSIIAIQRGYKWHPGAFVGTGRFNTLYALEPGYVRFTKEVLRPHFMSHLYKCVVKKIEPEERENVVRTFVHVVPEPQVGRFKLVKMI
ncbi:PREDICTED: 39S ribosomal protein L27, mitochondrial-like [Branchiostoma belcheri]|uniref:Large ribosomal subunit protein bL27m n=1 Tax=Branchiostoma belcheri TaxID=7741 RepID=A0A6P5AHF4_BRABE|nr:PREDICTED: 39S ribosomal protein L27, mitochondrial-like [Branchiostoma belcheri]